MRLGYVSMTERGATDLLLAAVARGLMDTGVALAGAVQTNTDRACEHHCDMDLQVLPDGPVLRISQNLGAGSSGCRLDPGALEAAVAATEARIDGAAMLIVNKFGKHEAEGRGFRDLIGEALSRGMPVLCGINGLNRTAFLDYAGPLAEELPPDPATILRWSRDGLARVAA